MIHIEKQIKEIVRKGINQLKESKLADYLASEKVIDALAKEYANASRAMVRGRGGEFVRMGDSEIKKDLVYFLEQNCGVCMSPSSISKALDSVWDKIQIGAKKYGYEGPISTPKKNDETPHYIIEMAEKVRSNENVMRSLGQRWYWNQTGKKHLVKGAMMSENYYGSYPNTILEYSKELGLYLSFKEAKAIVKYIKKDIQRYGKMVAAEKESLTEAVYKSVIKKLKKYNG